jgi:hypothetical protein
MGRHRRGPIVGGRCRKPSPGHTFPPLQTRDNPQAGDPASSSPMLLPIPLRGRVRERGGPQPRTLTGPIARQNPEVRRGETGATSSAQIGVKVVRSPGLMRLWCVECGRPSGPEARGWRLYRADDENEPDSEVTVLTAYCRACAIREFGELRARRKEAE